ncbi:hypothetical protein CEXT_81131 [Caerostris extrusa]|uniref:Uncharacterized protein n=1 Tax=Caerostris extrusa TaxID=172846 RepID=A0AAV4S6S7_CAEEX|nr:hypothetical protein CEXT_81131 [Caerostris extrusa]
MANRLCIVRLALKKSEATDSLSEACFLLNYPIRRAITRITGNELSRGIISQKMKISCFGMAALVAVVVQQIGASLRFLRYKNNED